MKIRKYITRKFLYRMLLFAAVVLGAVVFDCFHQGSEQLSRELSQRSESAHGIEASRDFCVNQASSFRLINGADKLFSGLVFAGTRSDLLSVRHNYRSFHLFKAEIQNRETPFLLANHFMKFNCCHHTSSGDSDPLA